MSDEVGAHVVFQAIWNLPEQRIVGYEALSRFADGGYLAVNASRAMTISGALVSLGSQLSRPLGVAVSSVELSAVAQFSPRLPARTRWCLSEVSLSDDGVGLVRRLQPHQVKIDARWLTETTDLEVRNSLQSLKYYCASAGAGADLIVQRIEVDEDSRMVERLGVALGQGYLLGRPRDVGAVHSH